MRVVLAVFALSLVSCLPSAVDENEDAFFNAMTDLCGQTFQGRVVSNQEIDADWISELLILGPVECDYETIRMPLAVGSDQSRTWVLSVATGGLIFRHEHVEPDGSPSAVTQYGGRAAPDGTAQRQAFPADDQTKANFTENGIPVSNTNVWTFTLDGSTLTYALARPATDLGPERDFRAEFDLN